MKEFKHKTTGHIATETNSGKNYKVSVPQNYTIPKWIIENSTDWEEVIEIPEYVKCIKVWAGLLGLSELLKIYKTNISPPFSVWSWDILIKQESFFKPSTKEAFDLQNTPDYTGVCFRHSTTRGLFKINEFNLSNYWLEQGINKDFTSYTKLEVHKFLTEGKWIQVPLEEYEAMYFPKPLFITDDDKEIFEGDKFYFVDDLFDIGEGIGRDYNRFKKIEKYKHFSTREAAKKYVDMNKPKYSHKNVEDALNNSTISFFKKVEFIQSLKHTK